MLKKRAEEGGISCSLVVKELVVERWENPLSSMTQRTLMVWWVRGTEQALLDDGDSSFFDCRTPGWQQSLQQFRKRIIGIHPLSSSMSPAQRYGEAAEWLHHEMCGTQERTLLALGYFRQTLGYS
jgi:hypothetical protein